jgi:hypothetical protein
MTSVETSGPDWTTLAGTKMRIKVDSPAAKAAARLGARGWASSGIAPAVGTVPVRAKASPPAAPAFDPAGDRPGAAFRELGPAAPELDGASRRAAEKMAKFAAADLALGHVGVSWYTDLRASEGAFAHPAAPSRVWVRADLGLTPFVAARRVAHECRHLRQFRDGLRPGGPRDHPAHDERLEADATRYAEDAWWRFLDAQAAAEEEG